MAMNMPPQMPPQFGATPAMPGDDVQTGRVGAIKRALARRPKAVVPYPAPKMPGGPGLPPMDPGGPQPGGSFGP